MAGVWHGAAAATPRQNLKNTLRREEQAPPKYRAISGVEGRMSIAKPGRRLLQNVPLPFVARKVAGGGQRPVSANLSLTSMIDFLVVTVVFLLMMFNPGQSAAASGATLPEAVNFTDMLEAPMVTVAKSEILLDGKEVGTIREVELAQRVHSIEDLSRALVAKRETWKQLHPQKPFPGALVLQIDQDVPSIVVKSIFQTAAHAGYPAISFMVQRAASAGAH
jgi:biopolymer transport protein ExbD